jgi:hypothetical protein
MSYGGTCERKSTSVGPPFSPVGRPLDDTDDDGAGELTPGREGVLDMGEGERSGGGGGR